MAFLVNNEAEVEMLRRIVCNHIVGAGDTLILRLYDTNITPGEGDTWLRYVQSGGTGYAAITLKGDSWTFGTGAGDTSYATYAQQTFTYSGGDTLYGYYVTCKNKDGDTIVMLAEKFSDGPYTIPSGGGTVKVTPRIQLD